MADVYDDDRNAYSARFVIEPKIKILESPSYREWLVGCVMQPFAKKMTQYFSPDVTENEFLRNHSMSSTWNNDGLSEQWHRADDKYENEVPDFIRFTLKKYDKNGRGIEFDIEQGEKTLDKIRFLYKEFDRVLSAKSKSGELRYDVRKNFDNNKLGFTFGSN